jgi:hypothetical protein
MHAAGAVGDTAARILVHAGGARMMVCIRIWMRIEIDRHRAHRLELTAEHCAEALEPGMIVGAPAPVQGREGHAE